MRILLYTQWCTPEPAFKSVPFARELRRRGHDARILTGFPNYPGGRLYPGYRLRLRRREEIDGVPILRVPLFPSHDASAVRRIANYLTFAASSALPLRFGWKPDVVYVYNLVTLGAVASLGSTPFVLDVQDLWPDSIQQSGMWRPWMTRAVNRLCRRVYTRAARIAVQSPGFARLLAQRGVPDHKLDLIYNWCDESPPVPAHDPESRKADLGLLGRFNVLYAGNLGAVQGLDAVIEAARLTAQSHPRIQWVLMGPGVRRDQLQTKAASLAPRSVRFLPACPPADAAAILQLADALLIHLRRDPLFAVTIPSKTQSYLAAGRPILAGVSGDAADLVVRAGAGVAGRSEDPAELAAAAIRLSEASPDDRAAMGRNGRAFYLSHLAMEHGIRRFETLFEAALRNPPPR